MIPPDTFQCDICGRHRKRVFEHQCPICKLHMDDICAFSHLEREHRNDALPWPRENYAPVSIAQQVKKANEAPTD